MRINKYKFPKFQKSMRLSIQDSQIISFAFAFLVLNFLCIFIPYQVNAAELQMNDISVLYPLPLNAGDDFLLKANTNGKFGPLVSEEYFNQIPQLDDEHPELVYNSLRVVAVRLDPCFPSTNLVERCNVQIRMVLQPISFNEVGMVATADDALHVFYTLTEAEFNQLIIDIKKAKEDSIQDLKKIGNVNTFTVLTPLLDVNPIIKLEGLQGKFATRFNEILLSLTGVKKMTKITFMRSLNEGIWHFGGYEISDGKMKLAAIPNLTHEMQFFYNSSKSHKDFVDGGAIPPAEGGDHVSQLIANSATISNYSEQELIKSAQAAAKIENPQLNNPTTVDCVSCHMAQPARIWSLANLSHLNIATEIEPFIFKSIFDLTNVSLFPEKTTRLRVFGYDGVQPAIAQRTINESSEVLTYLKQKGF